MRALTITDNDAWTMFIDNDESKKVKVINCTLNNNQSHEKDNSDSDIDIKVNKKNILTIDGGDLGDTTFNDKSLVAGVGVGSIFGEGSLTVIVAIVALLALVASAVSIFMVASMKKKLAPAEETNSEETKAEDEE